MKRVLIPAMLVFSASLLYDGGYCENATQDLGPYEVIVQKDPFDPSRKISDSGETGGSISTGEDVKKRYHLYGTVMSGATRIAFLQSSDAKQTGKQPQPPAAAPQARPQGDRIQSVTVGDLVDGWQVEDITDKNVTLVSGNERIHITLFDSEKTDRKATAPVGIQTPRARPAVLPPPAKPPTPQDMPGTHAVQEAETSPPIDAQPPDGVPQEAVPPEPPVSAGAPPHSQHSLPGNAPRLTNPFPQMLKKEQGGTP
ncbi:MAG: hypothetical protein K6360_01465 [Deltaproteobacteria bacterium]